MLILEWIVLLLLGAVLLTALAGRIGVPSPSLLALGGMAVALIPNGPRFTLQPDLALALFVAPVLLDAAFDSSLRDLKQNWFPVTCLVVIAVGVTTAAVTLVAHWLLPSMPIAACIALGALVAPPDAAAATAILKEVTLPHRLLVVLGGESLLNDASALLMYRLAVGAATLGAGASPGLAPTLALVVFGSIAFGVVLALVMSAVVPNFSHVPSSIVVQFVGTFGVWILADRLHLSGVLAIVTFAVVLSRRSPIRMPAAVRVPSYAVWDTAVFVLNALAFLMIGLQVGPVVQHMNLTGHYAALRFPAAILLVVIVARLGWMMFYNGALRMIRGVLGASTPGWMMVPPWKGSMIGAWCGMRGIVTLAAAMALPDGTGGVAAFPNRDLILLTAFAVVLGTLVIQGLTLRPLVIAMGLEGDNLIELEILSARQEMFRAALESLGETDSEVGKTLRAEFSMLLTTVDGNASMLRSASREAEVALRATARTAARDSLNRGRLMGAIGDEAFQSLEAELDLIELEAEIRSRW
jgi:monovalent cation/hydrogen antiporter